MLIRPPLTRQPQYSAPVDRGDPITAGLTVLNVGNSRFNLVDRALQVEGGDWPSAATPGGIAARSDTAIRGRYWNGTPTPRGRSTIFAVAVARADGGNVTVGSYAGPSGENTGYLLMIDAGLFRLYTYPSYIQSNTTAPAAGSVFTCAAVGDPSTNLVRGWLNGQPFGSDITINGTDLARAGPAEIGTSASFNTSGGNILFAAWARALSAAELRSLHANPWQLLNAPARRMWGATASGPVIPTLSAATAIDITSTAARPRVTITF